MIMVYLNNQLWIPLFLMLTADQNLDSFPGLGEGLQPYHYV